MKQFLILILIFTISYAKDLDKDFKLEFEKSIREFEVAGGALAINFDNRDYIYSFGCAKLNNEAIENEIDYDKCQEVMKPEHKFKIGSISKTITANIVLKLIEEKKLSFDTKVSEILDINMTNYDLNSITIKELLTHTSGLFNFTHSEVWLKEYIYNPLKEYDIDKIFKIIDNKKNKKEFHYSNSNYIFLGKIIEKISGKKWEEEAKEFLNKSLKNHSFIVPIDNREVKNLARGYSKLDEYDKTHGTEFSNDKIIYYDRTNLHPNYSWSAGSIITNIKDLNRWMKIIAEGELYKKEFFEKNIKNTDNYIKTKYFKMGYGIGYYENLNALFHYGAIDGYSCLMIYDLDLNASISTCVNGTLLDKKPFFIKKIATKIFNLIEAN